MSTPGLPIWVWFRSPTLVTDTNGDQVGMPPPPIGFPYFLLCYHGVGLEADLDSQSVGRWSKEEGRPEVVEVPQDKMASNMGYGFMPENIDWAPPNGGVEFSAPTLIELAQSLVFFAFIISISLDEIKITIQVKTTSGIQSRTKSLSV